VVPAMDVRVVLLEELAVRVEDEAGRVRAGAVVEVPDGLRRVVPGDGELLATDRELVADPTDVQFHEGPRLEGSGGPAGCGGPAPPGNPEPVRPERRGYRPRWSATRWPATTSR